MNIIRILTPAALAVAISFTAAPAQAQDRGRDNRDRGRVMRDGGRNAGPRQDGRQVQGRAAERNAGPRQDVRQYQGRAPMRDVAPRRYDAPRYQQRYEPRRDRGPVYVAPRAYRPTYRAFVPYRPHYFGRPYYSFRPHLNIGFGLWIGYGVPYPRAWVTYAPPVYGYYQGAVRVIPNAASYGGLSFDLSPSDAAVYLDGEFIGYAGDFNPEAAPLTVTPGPHRIEVQAEGYQPAAWNVNVAPGEVIPFRGAMQPY